VGINMKRLRFPCFASRDNFRAAASWGLPHLGNREAAADEVGLDHDHAADATDTLTGWGKGSAERERAVDADYQVVLWQDLLN